MEDAVVTSFEVARMDIDLIDELPWSCIFIDEVHRVKNPRSKLATAFSRFTCACRFGLSGTGNVEAWHVTIVSTLTQLVRSDSERL